MFAKLPGSEHNRSPCQHVAFWLAAWAAFLTSNGRHHIEGLLQYLEVMHVGSRKHSGQWQAAMLYQKDDAYKHHPTQNVRPAAMRTREISVIFCQG